MTDPGMLVWWIFPVIAFWVILRLQGKLGPARNSRIKSARTTGKKLRNKHQKEHSRTSPGAGKSQAARHRK